jgi:multidrug resistance efflux pump
VCVRKFNFLYWLFFPLVIGAVIWLAIQLRISYKEYFGYAENRSSEINLDKDVIITDILVQMGAHVRKGQALMRVSNQDLQHEITQLHVNLQGVRIREDLSETEIEAEILELVRQRDLRLSELNTKITTAESDIQFYKSLSGLLNAPAEDQQHPKAAYVAQLREEVAQIQHQYEQLIRHYRRMLAQPKETIAQADLLRQRERQLQEKLQEFEVVAPYDGIVGNINVMEGEYVPAFSSLISYYETTPPVVLAFIQERFDIKVNVGDSVLVQSVYSPSKQVHGVVSAKGHRIVEIPEKLRKIPDVKIYGVEVFIHIPHGNRFLQYEVLKVRPLNTL